MSSLISRDGLSRVFKWEQSHPWYHYWCDVVQSWPSVIYSLSCRAGGLLRPDLLSLSPQGHRSFSLLQCCDGRTEAARKSVMPWHESSCPTRHSTLHCNPHTLQKASFRLVTALKPDYCFLLHVDSWVPFSAPCVMELSVYKQIPSLLWRLAQGNTTPLFALGTEEAVFCVKYHFAGEKDWQENNGY